MRHICLVVFGLVAAGALSAPRAGAQTPESTAAPAVSAPSIAPSIAPTTAPAATPAAVGPTMQSSSLSPRLDLQSGHDHDDDAAAAASYSLTNGQKLMILGGVTLIAGAIIGGTPGTIIMIGGAGIGIYGLYLQLGYTKKDTEIGYKLTL